MRRFLQRALVAAAEGLHDVDRPTKGEAAKKDPLSHLVEALERVVESESPAATTPAQLLRTALHAAEARMPPAKNLSTQPNNRPCLDDITTSPVSSNWADVAGAEGVTTSLLSLVLSGSAGRALKIPALSAAPFPSQSWLTYHTSSCAQPRAAETVAAAQVRATEAACRLEKLAANHIAKRLGLPSRFLWADAAAKQSGERQAVLGVQLHTWTPVVVDHRGERHVLSDTQHRDSSNASATGMFATPSSPRLLGHGTATEARALFAFNAPPKTSPCAADGVQRAPASPSSVPPTSQPTSCSTTSHEGGGVLYNNNVEAYMCVLHTARTQALTRCHAQGASGPASEVQAVAKLVVYASDQADPQLLSVARLVGFQNVRTIQTISTPDTGNYVLSADTLKRMIVEDLAHGLFPCLVIGVLGSRWSGAVDPLTELAAFCSKTGVWLHVDASAGGGALLAQPEEDMVAGERHAYQNRALGMEADKLFPSVREACAKVDSVFVNLQQGALPVSVMESATGDRTCLLHAALFLSHTAKLAWSLRHALIGPARTQGHADGAPMNGWYLPNIATHRHALDNLHVSPPWERRGDGNDCALLALATNLSTTSIPAAALVRTQQDTIAELHDCLAADGRFDAPLRSALFGIVLFRWLTCTDEAVVRLAEVWSEVLWEWSCASAQRATVAVPIGVGVTSLQKRLWVRVSLTSPVSTAEEGRAVVNDAMRSLQEAATRCDL